MVEILWIRKSSATIYMYIHIRRYVRKYIHIPWESKNSGV